MLPLQVINIFYSFYKNCRKWFPSTSMHTSNRRCIDCRKSLKILGIFCIFFTPSDNNISEYFHRSNRSIIHDSRTTCLVSTFHELSFYSDSKVNKRFLDGSVCIWNQSLFEHLRMKVVFINMATYSNIEWADIHYMYWRALETAEKLNVSIKKSFLKGDALVKIYLVQSITDLGKQDLSYLIQLIEDETET
jgi:hypothetical protein